MLVYRDGIWFRFVRSALLLAVILCWVDRCFGSWVLLGFFSLLRVTHQQALLPYEHTRQSSQAQYPAVVPCFSEAKPKRQNQRRKWTAHTHVSEIDTN